MLEQKYPTYEEVEEGGDGALSEDQIRDIKAAISVLSTKDNWWSRQCYINNVLRYNKYNEFDGATLWYHFGMKRGPLVMSSNQFSWLVDEVCNEKVNDCLVALRRSEIRCIPRGLFKDDEGTINADRWATILRWLVDRMGVKWVEEHGKALNYMVTDSPAISMMRVDWKREESLVMKTLTVDEIATQWSNEYLTSIQEQGANGAQAGQSGQGAQGQATQITPEIVEQSKQEFLSLLMSPDIKSEDLVNTIISFFPRIKAKRAKKAAAQILKEGKADFPVPATIYEGPRITAGRFAYDWFCPEYTTDWRMCPLWVASEWLSRADLEARAKEEDWDNDFLEDVIKNNGIAAFPDFTPISNGWDLNNTLEYRENQYNILWVYRIATNEDGIRSRYCSIMHMQSEHTAYGQKLLRDNQNEWPAVIFQREQLDQSLLSSRGIPEIAGKYQTLVKRMRDMVVDNAEVAHLPPFVTIRGPTSGPLVIKNLKHINLPNANSSAAFMKPPEAPVGCQTVQMDAIADVDRYFARDGKDVSPDKIQARREVEIGYFLGSVKQELQIILNLAKTFMPEDLLNEILGNDLNTKRVTLEEISGDYEVAVDFDVVSMSEEKITRTMKEYSEYIAPLNGGKTIDSTGLSEMLLKQVMPTSAQKLILPKASATQKDLDEEQKNYLILRSGGVPVLKPSAAVNYEARIGFYTNMMKQNPAVFEDMAPDKKTNLVAWIKSLQMQNQQFNQNANIGRSGLQGTTGPEMSTQGL